MRDALSGLAALLTTVALLAIATPLVADEGMSPAGVFEQLKEMDGTWDATAAQVAGEPMPDEEGPLKGQHQFTVSAAGTVVMEVMGPGTDHEMINMYHMDGEDLVLTHYCAAGNQPTMKLDREMLAAGKTHFAFTGGTNLDPEADQHIHSTMMEWQEDGSLVEAWSAWAGGEEAGVMEFVLTPAE